MRFGLTNLENKIWKEMVKALNKEEIDNLRDSARTRISCIRRGDMYIIKITVNDVLFFAAKTKVKLSFSAMEKAFIGCVDDGVIYKPWYECNNDERVNIYKCFNSLAKDLSYKKDIVKDSYMQVCEISFSLDSALNPNLKKD